MNRYLIPRVKNVVGTAVVNTKVDAPRWGNDVRSTEAQYNLAKLKELYSLPWRGKYMLIYRSRKETEDNNEPKGERLFREFCCENGVAIIDCKLDSRDDYRDAIHPNQSGQRKLSEAIIQTLGY